MQLAFAIFSLFASGTAPLCAPPAEGQAAPPACLGPRTADGPANSSAAARSVLGTSLKACGAAPLTGWRRDGRCDTGPEDAGVHVVCAQVSQQFLDFSKAQGNDLVTPVPAYRFPGVKAGDRWCLCAERYREALQQGVAPPVDLAATHERALEFLTRAELDAHVLLPQARPAAGAPPPEKSARSPDR